MKCLLFAALCLLPGALCAAALDVCDNGAYEVTIKNGGTSRTATISAHSGEIYEYGPAVSFQVKGQKEVIINEPSEEYCIWGGKIKLQRYHSFGSAGGGGSLR